MIRIVNHWEVLLETVSKVLPKCRRSVLTYRPRYIKVTYVLVISSIARVGDVFVLIRVAMLGFATMTRFLALYVVTSSRLRLC